MKQNKIIAIVGMCGAGKSVASDFFQKNNFLYLRFGQITMDEIKRRNLKPNEKLEKEIRENFRKKHGMAAFAVLNLPRINDLIKTGHVVIDGLYSWAEYKILKKHFPNLIVIAIYASPTTRYQRISQRQSIDDPELKNRNFTITEAQNRDYAEIENVEKGGPIAMADYTIVNEGEIKETIEQLRTLLKIINY